MEPEKLMVSPLPGRSCSTMSWPVAPGDAVGHPNGSCIHVQAALGCVTD